MRYAQSSPGNKKPSGDDNSKSNNNNNKPQTGDRQQMKKLYAIYDIVAQMIVGHISIITHDAAAIRMFSDVATAKEPNMINQHLADFNLICLGNLLENVDDALAPTEIDPYYKIVITGEQLLAATTPEPSADLKLTD